MKYSDIKFGTLAEIVSSVEQQMVASFYDGKSSVLRKNVLKVIASVVGAALYMVLLVVRKMWRNRFASTCDIDCLDSIGAEYGMPHKPATYASGYVIVNLVSGETGSVSIPSGTKLFDSITKAEYQTIETASVKDGSSVKVAAVTAGDDYNLDAGTELTFDSVDDRIQETATVDDDGLNGGRSVEVTIDGNVESWGESAEEYRERLLYRIQNPPKGGALNDYRLWAERFSYVSRAFVFGNYPNANSVVVACANFNSSASTSLTTDQISEVNAYINADERRPITADVRVMTVTSPKFELSAYITPFNDSVKDSVKAALQAIFETVEPDSYLSSENIQMYVLANSIAETFKVTSIKKNSETVTYMRLDLSVPTDSSKMSSAVAEVISLNDGSTTINLLNGEV